VPDTAVTQLTDSRRTRSDATKKAIMRAAEKLIAQSGVENISIKKIVGAAGQKNESALQYHFTNLSGLLEAIHHERSEQTRAKRAALLSVVLAETSEPSLRELCVLMVEPIFQLARSDLAFRRYIKAFGHELIISDSSPLKVVSKAGGGGTSGQQIGVLLRKVLPHLSEVFYRQRMEAAVRLCSASMYHQARQANAFRGHESDLFLHNLVDALVGLLSAPISSETRALEDKV
jgi:AcrR family transcriptional regulator